MNILITAATAAELRPAREAAETLKKQAKTKHHIHTVETSIGAAATAYHSLKAITATEAPYDLILNIGIAGTFHAAQPLGSVVRITREYFGDTGIQTAAGFESLFEAQLLEADTFPFKAGALTPPLLSPACETALSFLPQATGVTVQRITDCKEDILRQKNNLRADIESMEGAAFFYVCICENIPCLAVRSISNQVGERDKSKWDIPLALSELGKTLKNVLHQLA